MIFCVTINFCLCIFTYTSPTPLQRDLFQAGHVLFYKEDWEEMVQMLELSLKEFYTALDDCKDMCNGAPLRYSPVVGFAQTMSQQFMGMMECRLDCVKRLGEFRYNNGEDFFGSYFHYLQQGYYFREIIFYVYGAV